MVDATVKDVAESMRVKVFDQHNLISVALEKVYGNPEVAESLLKSIERLNDDLYRLYEALKAKGEVQP